MPTRWETFPVNFNGGLITNIAPLTQGLSAPGSARSLINFEPSIEGGYRRVNGYSKFDDNILEPYGSVLVHGSGQSGTSLTLANIHTAPEDGETLTIAGVTGTYTIDTGGVSFDATNNRVTLTLTSSLASSPADKAAVSFTSTTTLVTGVYWFDEEAVAVRGSEVWSGLGSGWSRISTPSYGTCLVDGGAQTGTSLDVDGLTVAPRAGDTFTIDGVDLVYTVTADASLTVDAATLTISPALDSSPADNAAITYLSFGRTEPTKTRWDTYNFAGTPTLIGVDGVNLPFKYDGTTFTQLVSVPSEVSAADHVAEFKSHIFLAQGNTLVFSAPYSDTDYTGGSGGGSIVVPSDITGLILFREQLIIFCLDKIYRLTGDTVSSFQLEPISYDIGCIETDTIQEVGGDIVFLGPDGVRLLSATERIGDFGLNVASRPIQAEVNSFRQTSNSFSSCVVREKSQYRIFGYRESIQEDSSKGFVATQFIDQSAPLSWAQLRGFKVYCSCSIYSSAQSKEIILFGNSNGYIYQMEQGSSFDGANIRATFHTPFWSINDPRLRKTIYKITSYLSCEGGLDGAVSLRFDFDDPQAIQPSQLDIVCTQDEASRYGTALYGVATYGSKMRTIFTNQAVGSGFTVSAQYTFNNTKPPFSLDSVALEFATEDRQ